MLFFLNAVTLVVLLVLGIFSLRRLVFVCVALFAGIDYAMETADHSLPSVTLLIPCHNEETVLSATLDALLHIAYPEDKLEIVVIDDLSSDNTWQIAHRYDTQHAHIHAYRRSHADTERGKAAAINEALSRFNQGEVVYFLDADHRLRPDGLMRLVRYFSDPKVGAVGGRCIPWNKYETLISSYVYLESLVHHRITMYASDRLGLAPVVLGSNFCIRRPLLEDIGCFSEHRLTEDIDLTARIYEFGYRVKYDVTSVSEHEAPRGIRTYILQHLRWNRGYNQVARSHWRSILRNQSMSFLRRVDELMFSLGYVDRFFFFIALGLTFLSLFVVPSFRFPFWVWGLFLGVPALQVLGALAAERERISIYFRLPLILSMFSLDILVALIALYQDAIKKPTRWYKTCRAGDNAGPS